MCVCKRSFISLMRKPSVLGKIVLPPIKRFPIYQELWMLPFSYMRPLKVILKWGYCDLNVKYPLQTWVFEYLVLKWIYWFTVVEPSKGRILLKEVGHWGWGLRFYRPAPHPVCSLLWDSHPNVATCRVLLHLTFFVKVDNVSPTVRWDKLSFTLRFVTSVRPC